MAPDDATAAAFSIDPAARSRIEKLAMNAVRHIEESRGCRVVDVSGLKCGWDITSYPPIADGKQPDARHIEVKGRVSSATVITVTRNEILYSLNKPEDFILAMVEFDGDRHQVHYIRRPFQREPDFGVTSVNYSFGELLARASRPS